MAVVRQETQYYEWEKELTRSVHLQIMMAIYSPARVMAFKGKRFWACLHACWCVSHTHTHTHKNLNRDMVMKLRHGMVIIHMHFLFGAILENWRNFLGRRTFCLVT